MHRVPHTTHRPQPTNESLQEAPHLAIKTQRGKKNPLTPVSVTLFSYSGIKLFSGLLTVGAGLPRWLSGKESI